jgi:hypothetical protein
VAVSLALAPESLTVVPDGFGLTATPVGLAAAPLEPDPDPEDFDDVPEPFDDPAEVEPFGLASSSASDSFVGDAGDVALGADPDVVEVDGVATGVVAFVAESPEPEPVEPVVELLAPDPLDDSSSSSSTGPAGAGAWVVVVDCAVVVAVVVDPSSSDSCAVAGAATTAMTIATASRPTGVRRERCMRSGRHICPRSVPRREISHPCQVSVIGAGFRRWGRYAPFGPAWQSPPTASPGRGGTQLSCQTSAL